MLLSELKHGQHAIITQVLPTELKEKLMEMGCVKGVEVHLIMKAPFGDPIAFDIDGYCLSMRKKEASNIEIHLLSV
jgi:Fe2+ transport system protein FeoA